MSDTGSCGSGKHTPDIRGHFTVLIRFGFRKNVESTKKKSKRNGRYDT